MTWYWCGRINHEASIIGAKPEKCVVTGCKGLVYKMLKPELEEREHRLAGRILWRNRWRTLPEIAEIILGEKLLKDAKSSREGDVLILTGPNYQFRIKLTPQAEVETTRPLFERAHREHPAPKLRRIG